MNINEKFSSSLLLSVLAMLFSSGSYAQERPNVVLMLADNLGYGDLSVYNGGYRGGMQTPNIDKLAGQGLRFTQFLVEPGCTYSVSAGGTIQWNDAGYFGAPSKVGLSMRFTISSNTIFISLRAR